MNVINVSKCYVTILVVAIGPAVFKATSLDLISTCIVDWAGIKDFNGASSELLLGIVALTNISQEIFIATIPLLHEGGQRLTTPPN